MSHLSSGLHIPWLDAFILLEKEKQDIFPTLTLGRSFFVRLYLCQYKMFLAKEKVLSFYKKNIYLFIPNKKHLLIVEVSLD